MKKKLSKSTCLHCVFMKALRQKWVGRKGGELAARADMIGSAMKIATQAMMLMSEEERAQVLKDLSAPPPSFTTVLDAIKSAFEKVGAKVTEH